jgi:hypothetical protein
MSDKLAVPAPQSKMNEREISVDSAGYFEEEEDGHGGYDDFAVNNGKGRGGGGGGGGGGGTTGNKIKPTDNKKPQGKGMYSSKHIRAKEALRQNPKASPKK